MRMVESADGTVKVVELDPAKWYWIVLDQDSDIDPEHIRRVDGVILMKRPGATIEFVENADRVQVPA